MGSIVRLLQALVVMLNVGPFCRLFRAIYAAGVWVIVAALRRHPAVHSIYGCGSFFHGDCLYGHSDIDLVIVLAESASRNAGYQSDLARTYNRVRRFFPFLGRWGEKAANLIFLEEVRTGFPVIESFRVRMKQGRLVRLHGDAFTIDLATGPITASEIMAELSALVRVAALTGGRHPTRLLFWRRLFTKLEALAAALALESAAASARAAAALGFGEEPDRALFFRNADPEALFSHFLALCGEFLREFERKEDPVRLRFAPYAAAAGSEAGSALDVPARGRKLFEAAGAEGRLRAVPSVPIGMLPRLFYFPIDAPMTVVELAGPAYPGLRALIRAAQRHGASGEALLVRAEDVLYILSREELYVDVVPLNPLMHANLYAWIGGATDCAMPRSIYKEQRAEAMQLFAALRRTYQKNDGCVPKVDFPCIYREDELDTMSNAFHVLRSLVADSDDRLYLLRASDLTHFYQQRHPECTAFLADLLDDYRFFVGAAERRSPANNLYRCLHQFMVQVLGGAPRIGLCDPRARLGISVGIITRNRAPDLQEALASLTRQRRPPDEVIVVDNGSTDHTKAVVQGFRARLPVRYVYLGEPGIPQARNRVIEEAAHEVIAFTDDDCAAEPDWLAAVERGFLRGENVGVVAGWVLHWPADRPTTIDAYYATFHHNKP